MKDNTLSRTAFVVVLTAIILMLAILAFADGIRKVEWMNLELMGSSCFGLVILGCILGWCSFSRPLGKASAILGTVVVVGVLFQLLRTSVPQAPRTFDLDIPKEAVPK
jgi:hypothetical protein